MSDAERATLLAMVCELCRERGMSARDVALLFTPKAIRYWFAMKKRAEETQ
jgi:hypothetical protein